MNTLVSFNFIAISPITFRVLHVIVNDVIIGVLRNGLNLLGVSPFWQGSAIGSIIIVALLVERLINWRSGR